MAALLMLSCAFFSGCVDVRSFAGTWTGGVVPEAALLEGFKPDAQVTELLLGDVDLRGLSALLTTSDGRFARARLTPVAKFANDQIATLTFDGDPLRSYLLFSPLATEPQAPPALMLISLFGDNHVELRVIRQNDLFGVFSLGRQQP